MMQRDRALARQLERYYVRFNDAFWAFFASDIEPLLATEPVLVDLGSGPGLYLRDVSARLPKAVLHGVDSGADMLEHARSLEYAGAVPTMHEGDIAGELPFADGSVNLVTCTAVMHLLEDPFRFLEEVRRVLAPDGLFLLYDWARVPFGDYIDFRDTEPGDPPEARYPRALELFAAHNKYTADDWRWIFQVGRYEVVKEEWPYVRAIALLTRPV